MREYGIMYTVPVKWSFGPEPLLLISVVLLLAPFLLFNNLVRGKFEAWP